MESGPRKDTNCATHPYPCNHEVALSVSPTNRMLQILNSLVQAKPYTRVSRGNQSKVHSFEKKSENSFSQVTAKPRYLNSDTAQRHQRHQYHQLMNWDLLNDMLITFSKLWTWFPQGCPYCLWIMVVATSLARKASKILLCEDIVFYNSHPTDLLLEQQFSVDWQISKY